jgi:hypothetical protein
MRAIDATTKTPITIGSGPLRRGLKLKLGKLVVMAAKILNRRHLLPLEGLLRRLCALHA